MIQNLINKVVGGLRPNNERKQEELTEDLQQGKTIKFNAPKSNRYTYNRWLSNEDKTYNNFTPKTEKEKETLSPEGYFQGKEVKQKDTEHKDSERLYQASIPSTAIKSFTYDPKTESLYVRFTKGNKTYFYPRVPKELIQKWMKAPSKGEFFFANIHDQYTLNPGHTREGNQKKEDTIHNYYKKMQKYYKNVRNTGRM